ncbi:putative iron/ascorbate oxidoreductase [Smittium mucronatum]|uniref:Putative iron/ascorbate oxidoreductase n=1 Tax=Smittium mucronatum TaxID=133383 RepID=A0A1R0GQV1_9FUNG|nr:putative iron/ascorbate oxidoreductase [Smittium mucronatum]
MEKAADFTAIPVLDLNLINQGKEEQLLDEMRNALINVGFFYVKNHGVPQSLLDKTKESAIKFFDQPLEVKEKFDKIHSRSFYGYSKQGFETTKGKKDNREQYDFGDVVDIAPKTDDPEYYGLYAPFQYPTDDVVPGFKDTYEELLRNYNRLGMRLLEIVAKSLGLPYNVFDKYFEKNHQNRAKVIKYPSVSELDPLDGNQGVGPHKDQAFTLTLLYQADFLPGLQALNNKGEWIDVTPLPGTFVVNIGTGLEILTDGITKATIHRVNSPPAGMGPRYSIPYFLGVRLDEPFKVLDLPTELEYLRAKIKRTPEEEQFKQDFLNRLSTLMMENRVRSHPDVGYKHYPEIAKRMGIDENTKF